MGTQLVRLPVQRCEESVCVWEAGEAFRHGRERVAGRKRLAGAGSKKHEVLPAFRRESEYHARQWTALGDGSRQRGGGPVCLRPRKSRSDHWRTVVLRAAALADWAARSTS